MRKLVGKVLEMNFIDKSIETFKGKEIRLNVFSILIEGEKKYLITKRDENINNDIVGKIISYRKSETGLIYKSKVIKNQQFKIR